MEEILELAFAVAVAFGVIGSVVVLLLRGSRWDVVGRRHPAPPERRSVRAGQERPSVDAGWREGSAVARFVAHEASSRTPARPSPAAAPISVSPPVGCYSGARSRGYGAVGSASRSQ